MATFEGKLNANGIRLAIVASRFNDLIVDKLVDGARGAVTKLGGSAETVDTYWVPGAFEIPGAARRIVATNKHDAVVCLGAVIRGSTPHFDYVAGESAKGIANLAMTSAVPVINGVLTTDSIEQALERAGTKAGNKGADAALAAIEMVDLYRAIDRGASA